MLSLRRKAVQSAPRLRALYSSKGLPDGIKPEEVPEQYRRLLEEVKPEDVPEQYRHLLGKAQHDDHHDHHHEAPIESESLGTQFFVVGGIIATVIGVYTFSRPNEQGDRPFTKLLSSFREMEEERTKRNALHTDAVERAAFDRNLFQSYPGSKTIQLKMPDMFNAGSPYNIVAGSGARGMDELVKHYEGLRDEVEQKKLDDLAAKEKKAGSS